MTKALNKIDICRVFSLPMVAVLLLLLTACHNPITNPKPIMLQTEVDKGPDEYRLGFKHGCESALAAYGNSYQKTWFTLQKDPRYYNNRMYNQIWKDAWNYCYMWLFVHNSRNPTMYGSPF